MATIEEEKRAKVDTRGLIGAARGMVNLVGGMQSPQVSGIASSPQQGPDNYSNTLLQRAYGPQQQTTPLQGYAPQAQPAGIHPPENVYNLYDPNGPEARANQRMLSAVGRALTPPDLAGDRRRNSEGSRQYQEGIRRAGRDNPVGMDVTSSTLTGGITSPISRPSMSFGPPALQEPEDFTSFGKSQPVPVAVPTQYKAPEPSDFVGGIFGTPVALPSAPMTPASLDRAADAIPRSYVYRPGINQPLAGPAPEGATRKVKLNADTGGYYTEDTYEDGRVMRTILSRPTTETPQAKSNTSMQVPSGVNRPAGISPSASQELGIRKDSSKSAFGELSVRPGYAPQLKTGFTSPAAFSRIIGYDQNENPIYNDAAAAMRAANEGISAENKAAVDKFQQENALYASVTGGVPLQQAQAALAGTTASEMPGENRSQQKKRADEGIRDLAQAELFTEQAKVAGISKPPTIHYGETETMVPGGGIEQTPYASVVQNGELRVLSPKQAGREKLSITPKEQSILAKHFGNRKDVTQQEISAYLKTIR